MTDLEVQQHPKDCLFHGVCQHIHDSINYLYSTSKTSYSQLMATTHKEENENEEIQDKVRARAMVMTEPGEGTVELGQQIAKLRATLTKAGQGNSPSSTLSSPQERGCRRKCNSSSNHSCPNSHNGRSGLGQMTPA